MSSEDRPQPLELFQRFSPMAIKIASRARGLFGYCPAVETADLTQICLIKIWQTCMERGSQLSAMNGAADKYLVTCCYNAIRSYKQELFGHNYQRNIPHLSLDNDSTFEGLPLSTDDAAIRDIPVRILIRRHLDPSEATVIERYIFNEDNTTEIGEDLGMSRQRAWQLVTSEIGHLRRVVVKQGGKIERYG